MIRPSHTPTPALPAEFKHPIQGNKGAPILVLCDPPTQRAFAEKLPMSADNFRMFARAAKEAGLVKEDFVFLGLCPPISEQDIHSASRKWKHILAHEETIKGHIEALNPACIVTLGDLATRVVMGRSLAITKARGNPVEKDGRIVLPMLSPGYILYIPDHLPTFNSDLMTLARLKKDGFTIVETDEDKVDYRWAEDIAFLLESRPTIIGLDTETTGLTWHDPSVKVLTVQISWAVGKAICVPVDKEYWPAWNGRGRAWAKMYAQLKELLEDVNVQKVGHNLKFDVHMLRKLGIEVQGWTEDTQLMAFAMDENMMQKSLDECVRRWVPPMSGYADAFNSSIDKSKMAEVPHELMLPYAAGDADASLRLFWSLRPMIIRDQRQFNIYRRVLMPSIRTFCNNVERVGMLIDQERLAVFEKEVEDWLEQEYSRLIRLVPAQVRRDWIEKGNELKFTPKFIRTILFTKEGFNLTPVVFTPSTAKLEDVSKREPSTSTKQHLPFFFELEDEAGEFVRGITDYQKTTKLLSTYLNGFWKYIAPNGRIYPSYKLHGTVTGRTASENPNGQNFPKRGRWAKAYQKIFKATPGYKLINCDLSQIELRLAAWQANDTAMLRIYRNNGDIHTATAKAVSRLTDDQWERLSSAERKLARTKAKAVNFGFLYSMWWKKFMSFAKTDYGVNYTPEEAKQTRELFFATYRGLEPWHTRTKEFVHANGYVRSLHGAIRHLPSIDSNDEKIQQGAERQAINSPIQRFGSDLGILAMTRFSLQADPDKFRIIGFVHDALVMEVKDGYEKEGLESLIWCMQNLPLKRWFGLEPPIPLLAEADIGLNGGEMLEFADLPPEEERPQWFKDLGFTSVTPRKPVWWDDAKEQREDDLMVEQNSRLFSLDEGRI